MDRKRTVTPQDNEQVSGRLHLSGLGKASAAVISVVGTITATLFLLVDHGVFSSGDDQKHEPAKVLNVAVREMRAPLLGGSDLAGESQLGNLVADAYPALTGATKRVATAIGDVQALAQYIGALARPFDSGIQGRIIRLQ